MTTTEDRLAALEGQLGLLNGRTEVLDALYRLQSAIDRRDWSHIGRTFLPDATGYGVTGVDRIVRQMRDHLDGCGPTQHLLGNPVVDLDGEGATVHAYARVYHVGAGTKEGSFFDCLGNYTDRWVRTPDGWRLQHRRFAMRITVGDFDVLQPAP